MKMTKAKRSELEGFQPQNIGRVMAPTPSAVKEDTTRRKPVELYLKASDVPEEMRLVYPPSVDTRSDRITIKESEVAITALLEGIAQKRLARAVAEAEEPGRKRVIREMIEALHPKAEVETKVEVQDDGEEQAGSPAEGSA